MNWKDFIFSLPFDGNENGLMSNEGTQTEKCLW